MYTASIVLVAAWALEESGYLNFTIIAPAYVGDGELED
jgi:hypothetical protein